MYKKYPDRIFYNNRINSQLSIAKYSWGITIQGESYLLDYENCKVKWEGEEALYKPDLVKASTLAKKKK